MLNVNIQRETVALGVQGWDCARWVVLNVYRKDENQLIRQLDIDQYI